MSGEFKASFKDKWGDFIDFRIDEDGWLLLEFDHKTNCFPVSPDKIQEFITAVKELETYLTNNQK